MSSRAMTTFGDPSIWGMAPPSNKACAEGNARNNNTPHASDDSRHHEPSPRRPVYILHPTRRAMMRKADVVGLPTGAGNRVSSRRRLTFEGVPGGEGRQPLDWAEGQQVQQLRLAQLEETRKEPNLINGSSAHPASGLVCVCARCDGITKVWVGKRQTSSRAWEAYHGRLRFAHQSRTF